jgi:hypothetical protein
MDRLPLCIHALRGLASTNDPTRAVLIEARIDEYLRTASVSLSRSLEGLRKAIHDEEAERRSGEDWSIAKDYVRSLLHRMT